MTVLRPWYFKDGSPVNSETIRKIVEAAGVVAKATEDTEPEPEPLIPRDWIAHACKELAKEVTKRVERNLVELLQAEFESLRRYRFSPCGDPSVDAKRMWRRRYMRRYRVRKRAQMKMAI